jgi:hypothetical protein
MEAEVRGRQSINKLMALKFGMEKFNLMKLKVVRVRLKYRLKISKFSGFGKLCGHKSGL